jgi:hypothetical protein
MTAPLTTERPAALGQGTANTTAGSQVELTVAPEPMAYLRLDTGEVVGVPAADVAELHNEFDRWNRLIHCVFQPIVDGISGWSWTAFQRDRGRCFSLIVDAASAVSWTMGVARK